MKRWPIALPATLALTTFAWAVETPFSEQIEAGLLNVASTEAVQESESDLNPAFESSTLSFDTEIDLPLQTDAKTCKHERVFSLEKQSPFGAIIRHQFQHIKHTSKAPRSRLVQSRSFAVIKSPEKALKSSMPAHFEESAHLNVSAGGFSLVLPQSNPAVVFDEHPIDLAMVIASRASLQIPHYQLLCFTSVELAPTFTLMPAKRESTVISRVIPQLESSRLLEVESSTPSVHTTEHLNHNFYPGDLANIHFGMVANLDGQRHEKALIELPPMSRAVSLIAFAHTPIVEALSLPGNHTPGVEQSNLEAIDTEWEGPQVEGLDSRVTTLAPTLEKTEHRLDESSDPLFVEKALLQGKLLFTDLQLHPNMSVERLYDLVKPDGSYNPAAEKAKALQSASTLTELELTLLAHATSADLSSYIQEASLPLYQAEIIALYKNRLEARSHLSITNIAPPFTTSVTFDSYSPTSVLPSGERTNIQLNRREIAIAFSEVKYATSIFSPLDIQFYQANVDKKLHLNERCNLTINNVYSIEQFNHAIKVRAELEKHIASRFEAACESADNLKPSAAGVPGIALESTCYTYAPNLLTASYKPSRLQGERTLEKNVAELDLLFSPDAFMPSVSWEYSASDSLAFETLNLSQEYSEVEYQIDLESGGRDFIVFNPEEVAPSVLQPHLQAHDAFVQLDLPSPFLAEKRFEKVAPRAPLELAFSHHIEVDYLSPQALAAIEVDTPFHPLYGHKSIDLEQLPDQPKFTETYRSVAEGMYEQVRANPHTLVSIPELTHSPSHELRTTLTNRDTRQTLFNLSRSPNLDELDTLCMHYDFKTEVEIATKADGLGYYFSVTISPYKAEHLNAIPQNILFVIDNNSFIEKERYKLTQQAVMKALKYLSPEDTFNIILSDKQLYTLSEKPLPYNKQSEELAYQFLKAQRHRRIDNSIPIYEILASVHKVLPDHDSVNTVILLSNGASIHSKSAAGQKRIDNHLQKALGDYSLFTVASGPGNNNRALSHVAEMFRGEFVYGKAKVALPRLLSRLVRQLNRPLLKRVHVNPIDAADIEILGNPYSLPDLYASRPLTIYGKTGSLAPFELMIQGKVGTQWVNIKRSIRPATAPMAGAKLRRICVSLDSDLPHISQL